MSQSELLNSAADQNEDELQSLRERISELDEQVTNLRRLEETIRRNNGLFEALLSASHDGIALTSPDAQIVRVIKPILGYGPSLSAGVSLYDVIHPGDRATIREYYSQVVSGRVRQVPYEVRVLNPEGSVVWIEGVLTDMLDDPNVLALVHNYRDITQRKQAEFAALEFAAVIEQAPFAFFSKDVEGYIQSWNSGAERLFGYTAEEIIGQHMWKLVPPQMQPEEGALRTTVIQSCAPIGPFPAVRVHKNGSCIPVELTLTPMIRDGRVRGILHLSRTAAI